MARKVKNVTIVDEGRDKGKVFVLTEKDALTAWKWGIRAMLAITKTGVQIPDEMMKMGVVGILAVGLYRLQFISWSDMEPLINEMLTCVQMMPTPDRPNILRPLFPDDIEEVSTLTTLGKEVFELHTGFFPKEMPSTSPLGGGGAKP
jgi:hypothetical protein